MSCGSFAANVSTIPQLTSIGISDLMAGNSCRTPRMESSVLDIKVILGRNLLFGLWSFALTLLAGLLALVLRSGGDSTGAAAVLGVVWVMATATVLSLALQVVLLTWLVLSQPDGVARKSTSNEADV